MANRRQKNDHDVSVGTFLHGIPPFPTLSIKMLNLEAIPFRSVNGSKKSVIRRNAIKVMTRTILPIRRRMKKVQNSVTEIQATIPLTNAADQTLVETAIEIANATTGMETDVTRIVQEPDHKNPAIGMVHHEKNKTRMKSGISEETTNRIAASLAVVEQVVKRRRTTIPVKHLTTIDPRCLQRTNPNGLIVVDAVVLIGLTNNKALNCRLKSLKRN